MREFSRTLTHLSGDVQQQIGQMLGLTAGTVKSRIARARLALAKLLKDFISTTGPG